VLEVPLVGTLPPQPPEAAQLLAFIELHVSVELEPLPTDFGEVFMVTCGADAGLSPPPPPHAPRASVTKASNGNLEPIIKIHPAGGSPRFLENSDWPSNLAAKCYGGVNARRYGPTRAGSQSRASTAAPKTIRDMSIWPPDVSCGFEGPAMSDLAAKFQRARVLHQNGQLSRARVMYEEILEIRPNHLDALNSLALIAGQSNDFSRAVKLFERALKIDPKNAAAHCNRGLALQQLKQLESALMSYDQAIALKADYAVAYYNRGNALKELGRLEAALESYDRAIAANAGFAQAYYNRGVLQQDLRQWDAALASYGRAIALKADYAEACHNRGVVLQEIEQWHAALESYDRAIAIDAGHVAAWSNRGVVLSRLKQWDAALASFDQAIAIKADFANAYFNRGNTLNDLKQYPESVESYDRAIALGSDGIGLYGSRRHAKMQICDWRDFAVETEDLIARIGRNEPASPPFHVMLMTDSAELQKQAAQSWTLHQYPPHAATPAAPRNPRRGKIGVGYFSADFHDHATMYLMAELFERHDRSRFEIIAISFGPDAKDAMRARLQSACSRFVDVRHLSDAEVAMLAREMQIDIAVDLKGLTQFGRPGIFARRAAPVQINYLGYPGTMGAEYIDYIIADRTLVPQVHERHYTEKIIFLPDSYQVNDTRRRIADKSFSREELGLPRSGFVFCCFNNSFKITPGMFDVWMRMLRRVEGSVLWLFESNPIASENLRREAALRNVNPARLIFAKFMALPDHLARHGAADLFLDTVPCNAHTTASDALWTGLPVLTCTGQAFASRVAASLLMAVEMPDLITSAETDYEELAVDLATHPERLAGLKRQLAERRLESALFDPALYATHLETAYTQIYERHQAGLPSEHIYV
jgi:predicted O-linked N-acetylglucosamine transferase (SPINDLY family)